MKAIAEPTLVPQIGCVDGRIGVMAYSSDGRLLATVAGEIGPILLWDARTRELKRVLLDRADSETVRCVQPVRVEDDPNTEIAFTPDSHFLAVDFSQRDKRGPHVALIDIHDGALAREIPATGYINAGRVRVNYLSDEAVLSDVRSGRHLLTLKPHEFNASGLADRNCVFSPDRRRFAAAADGLVRIFDTATGNLSLTLRDERGFYGKNLGAFGPITFSPDGRWIATAGEDPKFQIPPNTKIFTEATYAHAFTVKIWDAKSGLLHKVIPGYGNNDLEMIGLLRFSPNSAALLIGDGNALDWRDTYHDFRLSRHIEARSPYAVTPDGRQIMAGNSVLWDAQTGQKVGRLAGSTESSGLIAWSRDGSLLFTGDRVWKVREGKSGAVWPTFDPNKGGFFPDGRVWSTRVDRAEIRDPQTGRLLYHFGPLTDGSAITRAIAFSPEGSLLVTRQNDFRSPLVFRDIKSKAIVLTLEPPDETAMWSDDTFAFAPDGQIFAVVANRPSRPATLYLFDLKGKVLRTFADTPTQFSPSATIDDLQFSPEGRLLYASGFRGRRVYDLETGERKQMDSHSYASGAFPTADGKRYLVNALDATEIRDVATRNLVQRFPAPAYGSAFAVMSPDGRLLARAEFGTVALYDVATGCKLVTMITLPIAEDRAPAEWLVYTPEGYYAASPGGARQIRWRVGDRLYPASKYAARFQKTARVKAVIRSAKPMP